MTRRSSAATSILVLTAFVLAGVVPARAQSTAAPQDPASAPAEGQQPPIITAVSPEDALDPLEPDYSLVNLPTTLRLPQGGMDFHLTHRFNENLRCSSTEAHCFNNRAAGLFGLDSGANIGLEFRVGVLRHLQAIVQRTSLSRDIQLSAKYDAIHQSAGAPISLSAIASVEGGDNFGLNTPAGLDTQYSPALGLVVSREIAPVLALYVDPFWVHNTISVGLPKRDTGFLGLGGRLHLGTKMNIIGEVSPRIGGLVIRDAQFGFGIEKQVGLHVFALTFTNNPGTTFRQISQGGNPETLNLGFNLTRKFF